MTTQTPALQHSYVVEHSPIFYGWVVWFVCMVGLVATAPGQSFSISLFIDYYIVDFGLDRTTVSGLFGLGTFISAFALTWVGRQIDRYGNRRMSVIIALLFGLALLACSLIMGPITLLISFIAIRGLGQGALGLVSTTGVAQWFRRRRGQVLGFAMIAFALFQRFYLPAMQSFIDTHGWRAAWVLCGLVLLVGVLPLLAVFVRDRPEPFGLTPDGASKAITDAANSVPEENWQLSEALRTPLLWVFTIARMLAGAWGTALIFHQVSLFQANGYSAEIAANIYGEMAVITAFIMLLSGWLIDRVRPGFVIALQMLALIAISVLMADLNDGLLLPYTLALSVFMGLGAVFDSSVWVTLFGRQHQGAIRGFVTTTMIIGTAGGPLIFGMVYDLFGNYDAALWLGAGLAVIALVLGLMVKKPVKAVTLQVE